MTTPAGMHWNNLSNKQKILIDQRLYPEQWSGVGFLQVGETLKSVCELDKATLDKHNITYKQVADKLDEVWKAYKENDKSIYTFDVIGTKGHQMCPFSFEDSPLGYGTLVDCADDQGSTDLTITKKSTGEKLSFTQLHRHLIREHGFFESGSYRLDPEKAMTFFEMIPKN